MTERAPDKSPAEESGRPTPGPRISLIICTYNRAALLRHLLESLQRQTLDADLWEVVVVNNGSTDDTADVVRNSRLSNLRVVDEPTPGHSRARNSGIAHSRAEIIVFTDDDVIPEPNWLERIADCYDNVVPTPQVVGGPAFPLFPDKSPAWFDFETFETHSWGEASRFLVDGECFSGLNMSFRRTILEQVRPFDERAGMKGNALGLGDDTGFFRNIWESFGANANAYYSTDAVVKHIVPPHRTTLGYVLRRSLAAGQAEGRASASGPWERLLMAARYSAATAAHCARALLHPPTFGHWRSWVVQRVRPATWSAGAALGCVGLKLHLTERP